MILPGLFCCSPPPPPALCSGDCSKYNGSCSLLSTFPLYSTMLPVCQIPPPPNQERCLLCCVRLSKPLTSCTQSNWRAYCCLPMVLCHPCRSQSPRDSWDLSCLSGSVLSVCLGEGLKRVFSAESLDPKPVGGIHQGCCGEWKSNQPL